MISSKHSRATLSCDRALCVCHCSGWCGEKGKKRKSYMQEQSLIFHTLILPELEFCSCLFTADGKPAVHLLPESPVRSQKEHSEWGVVTKCVGMGPGGSRHRRWRKMWRKYWQSAGQGFPFLVWGYYSWLTQTNFVMFLKSLFFPLHVPLQNKKKFWNSEGCEKVELLSSAQLLEWFHIESQPCFRPSHHASLCSNKKAPWL